MSVASNAEAILRALSELWVSLGKDQENGVLRACAMTLIFAVDAREDSPEAADVLAQLTEAHPSRAIVLRIRPGAAPLESHVSAQCWMPFGMRRQICAERIELAAGDSALEGAARVLLGLAAPDLPVVLVCQEPRLFMDPQFRPLLELADKVIVDSRRAGTAIEMLRAIASRPATHDLAWTALTLWRESIACVFDDAGLARRISKIRQVTVRHKAGAPPPEALYLGAWLAFGCGPQAKAALEAGGPGDAIQAIRISGEGLTLTMSRDGASCLHVAWDSIVRSLHFTSRSDGDLLREELSILGYDAAYAQTLPRAIALAQLRDEPASA